MIVPNQRIYERDKLELCYNKMGQLKWFINAISKTCKHMCHVEKFATINKMMIQYKGMCSIA